MGDGVGAVEMYVLWTCNSVTVRAFGYVGVVHVLTLALYVGLCSCLRLRGGNSETGASEECYHDGKDVAGAMHVDGLGLDPNSEMLEILKVRELFMNYLRLLLYNGRGEWTNLSWTKILTYLWLVPSHAEPVIAFHDVCDVKVVPFSVQSKADAKPYRASRYFITVVV